MSSFASRARRVPPALTLIALVALGTACAQPLRFTTRSAVSPSQAVELTSARPSTQSRGRSSRHTIARAEADLFVANTAYDLVVGLRPEFLRRSARRVAIGSSTEPVVYMDALRWGSPSMLRLVPARAVMEITYVTPVEALLRFGPTHGAGAIVVQTRR